MTIGGLTIASPQEAAITLKDVGGASARAASGALLTDRAGVKRTARLRWSGLNASDAAALASATGSSFFTAKMADPVTGEEETRTYHCVERAFDALSWTDDGAVWKSVEMTWEEA